MARKEKTVRNYTYEGLGFPVLIEKLEFHHIQGEWLPHIDVEVVASTVFRLLPSKPSKLTGNELKFIRTYMNKSKPAFAGIFKLSHTAVTKWERAENSPAPISPSQELVLRLYLEDQLKVSEREFYEAYKTFESSVYSEEEIPLKIAL